MTKPKRKIKPYKRFNETEDQFVRENYRTMPIKEMARKLNRTPYGLKNRLKILGLEQPKELIEAHKVDSRFKPGHKPWNTGLKGTHFSRATEFKKGNVPPNTKHDGAISIRRGHKDRGAPPYKYIRISKSKWRLLHQVVWEEHNGKIPKGSIVVFKDGNSMNCSIDNLKLITKAENARRNQDPVKSAASMRKLRRAFKDLENDEYVVKMLTRDEKERKLILENNPELIELKRKQLKLRRKIKYATEQQT